MSKELLKQNIANAYAGQYNWALYFFRIDRRNRNPYIVHKIRFKNVYYLQSYAKALMKAVEEYQLEKIESVKNYTGENSKVTCDKISLNDELLKENWDYLFSDIGEASDRRIKGKYHGYILSGIPVNPKQPSVTAIKMANPVIEMQNKRSAVFHFTADDELDMLSDNICKLYMDADMIIFQKCLYAFNLKFESLFNMEKTMQKIKDQSIELFLQTNAFADNEEFLQYARSYKSPRTFLTLNKERLRRMNNGRERKKIVDLLKLKTDTHNRICFENKDEVALLIKYICYKIFKDDETKGLLEASNITKVSR